MLEARGQGIWIKRVEVIDISHTMSVRHWASTPYQITSKEKK